MNSTRRSPLSQDKGGRHAVSRAPRKRDAGGEQHGSALVWALLFVVITSGMVISHSIFLASHRKSSKVRHSQEALAENFGRSGLVEAVGWFHRQSVQPVLAFSPQRDPLATPPLFDTIDPSVGLVREFEISQSLWGRYEVRNSDVVDISSLRGSTRPGTAWDVGVRAYVYRRLNPALGFDEAPNRVLASTTMSTEMRGVVVEIPVLAAINIDDINRLLLSGGDIVIDGGGKPGVSYDESVNFPFGSADPSVGGTPAQTGSNGLDLSPENVFGMSLGEIQGYSDVVVPEDAARVGPIDGGGQILTAVRPPPEQFGFMLGDSMLVVDGDLILTNTSTSFVEGIVYVQGSLRSFGDLEIHGAVIVTGTMQLAGRTRVTFDDAIVQRVAERLSQYRLPRVVAPTSDF